MNNELTMVNENDEVMVNQMAVVETDNGVKMMMDLTQPRVQAYCSVNVKNLTEDEEVDFFNAINSTDKKVGDFINKVIKLKHVYCEIVKLTNEETGQLEECPRTVLIDEDGTGYGTCSKAIFGSLSKLFSMCGQPQDWKFPKCVEIKQISTGKVNKCLSLSLVKSTTTNTNNFKK